MEENSKQQEGTKFEDIYSNSCGTPRSSISIKRTKGIKQDGDEFEFIKLRQTKTAFGDKPAIDVEITLNPANAEQKKILIEALA